MCGRGQHSSEKGWTVFGQDFDELDPLVLIFICTFDLFNEGRYVYTFKSRCLENLELELANDVTVKLINAKGKHGEANTLLKNFLQYVMTNEPVDEFTEDIARQIVAVKKDPIVRRDFMVLATRIKDAKREGFAEGEASQVVSMINRKMQLKNMTCEEAMDDLDCTPKERQAYYDYVVKNR